MITQIDARTVGTDSSYTTRWDSTSALERLGSPSRRRPPDVMLCARQPGSRPGVMSARYVAGRFPESPLTRRSDGKSKDVLPSRSPVELQSFYREDPRRRSVDEEVGPFVIHPSDDPPAWYFQWVASSEEVILVRFAAVSREDSHWSSGSIIGDLFEEVFVWIRNHRRDARAPSRGMLIARSVSRQQFIDRTSDWSEHAHTDGLVRIGERFGRDLRDL